MLTTVKVTACTDCVVTAANGYSPEEWGYTPDVMPCGRMEPGETGPFADPDVEPYFSNADCDTCGQTIAGIRHDATILVND